MVLSTKPFTPCERSPGWPSRGTAPLPAGATLLVEDIVAPVISPRLLPRLGAHLVVRIGTSSLLLSALCMVVVSFARVDSPPIIIGLLIWSVASLGFITPNAVVGALSRHAAHAGSASALMGTMQFGFGAGGEAFPRSGRVLKHDLIAGSVKT